MEKTREIVLSVVISFRNEEDNLLELYSRIKKSFRVKDVKDYELIFVDDCSDDSSSEILRKFSKEDNKVIIIRTSRPFGNAECLMAGLNECKGQFVTYLDADLQDPPEMIPEMLEVALKKNLDIVHTKRTLRLGESRIKMLITKIGYFYLNKFGTIKFQTEVGDFKLFSRRVLNHLKEMKEVLPFPRGLINYLGFPSTTIEYIRQARFNGQDKSKFPLFSKKWIESQLDRTLISFSDAPLKGLFYLGMISLMLTIMTIIASIFFKFFGLALPGWTTIVVLVASSIGFQALFLGIMGLYLNAIFLQVKNRPIYIIDYIVKGGEKITFNGKK